MSRYRPCLRFSLQDRVKLVEIDRPGRVTGITINPSGIEYRVVYWDNGARRVEWVFDDEIKLI